MVDNFVVLILGIRSLKVLKQCGQAVTIFLHITVLIFAGQKHRHGFVGMGRGLSYCFRSKTANFSPIFNIF
jgi:hypothetical protein